MDNHNSNNPPLSCLQCRTSKVKCSRAFPCQRCIRLGLRCTPQVKRKRKAPIKTSPPGVPAFRIKTPDGVKYLKYTPMSAILKSFFELNEKGLLVRPRTLAIMRSWAQGAITHGYEPMKAALTMMVKALHIADWRDLLYDEMLQREMSAYTDNMSVDGPAGSMPSALDQGSRGVGGEGDERAPPAIDTLPPFMKDAFYSVDCASVICLSDDNFYVSFANEMFARLFLPAAGNAPHGDNSHRVLQSSNPSKKDITCSLEWCHRAMNPDDSAELFEMIGSMLFAAPSNPAGVSLTVRCRSIKGDKFVAVVRSRYYVKAGGRFWCKMVSVQPLPMSRFLLPIDDPSMEPLEMASLQNPVNSPLPVFDEPTKPQTCKTCQVMTTEMLQVHFRALVVDEKSGTKEAVEDANLFVGDGGGKQEGKTMSGGGGGGGGEVGESDTDDGNKKARYLGGRRRGGSHHHHHHHRGGGGSRTESSDEGMSQMVGEAKGSDASDDGTMMVVGPQAISACSSGNMGDREEWNELEEDADDEFWQAVWTADALVAEQAALQAGAVIT